MKKYDYIILGTGPAGYKLAGELSAAGKSILAVEGGMFGGTCPNVGCEPKIFLEGTVHTALMSEKLAGRGLVQPAKIDWHQLMQYKKARFNSWPEETKANFYQMGDVAEGYGKFVEPHVIEVNGEKYEGDKIIIATGAHSHKVRFPGDDKTHNSDDVLSLDNVPKRTAIIGGGYISMELGTFLAAAGSEVTILVRSDRVLRGFYHKYTTQLIEAMEKRNIHIRLFSEVNTLENADNGDGMVITTKDGSVFMTDYVLDASGRIPNIEKLDLDQVGIKYSKNGIEVNAHLETSVPGVYAIGDVANLQLPKLTTVGESEAGYLFNYLERGVSDPYFKPTVGTAAFTFPEIAQVGINPEVAQADEEHYTLEEHDLSGSSLYAGLNEKPAKLTLVFDRDDRLVGAAELSATAADDINNFIPAIALGISRADWEKQIVPIYPALADKIGGDLK
ncbi:NAD(P)/FAD-dependent oxidoreductase [Lactobacillus rodentium]|uniref:Glutathione reductase n=1 Tax=Lactobacillus rodentium TaxID=947835 RepID=A0A2Z6TFZ8_9LACO|nr:NAD(P)/FAD-dependent oxidoreductase [Lactobacillus rodentium]MCR1894777.1 NAD(P)/FAD-dependent oxidoreductase [Lactobacillus rodentium]GBG04972.1 glutathione reductase [Lactobacillus rodentium]